MAKQTFTTGQVLTAAQMTSLQETAMTGGPASTKTVSYVLVAADAGTRVAMNAAGSTTITVNTALFSAGDTVSIQNIGAGVCTVTAGTATVNTSGSLVLAQYQGGILYFTSASTAIFFQFATPAAGGGKVLQVVQGLKSDTFSTSSTSFTDVTGLSVTITPSLATSKILVLGQVSVGNVAKDGAVPATSILRLVRDSTTIFAGDTAGSRSLGFAGVMYADQINNSGNPFNFLDSPATTSSTTYKIQMLTSNASSTTYVNRSHNDSNAANVTRAASSIIVLEIGA